MTLQASGAISLDNIQTEFGGANPISLSEYYAGGSYVPAGTGSIPTSGLISLNTFYGTSAIIPAWILILKTSNVYEGETYGVYDSISLANAQNNKIYGVIKGNDYQKSDFGTFVEVSSQGIASTVVNIDNGNLYGASITEIDDMCVDSSGNKYTTGAGKILNASYTDVLLIKFNSSNVIQWVRVINHPDTGGTPGGSRILLAQDGYLYILHSAAGASLTKYSIDGVFQWSTRHSVMTSGGSLSGQQSLNVLSLSGDSTSVYTFVQSYRSSGSNNTHTFIQRFLFNGTNTGTNFGHGTGAYDTVSTYASRGLIAIDSGANIYDACIIYTGGNTLTLCFTKYAPLLASRTFQVGLKVGGWISLPTQSDNISNGVGLCIDNNDNLYLVTNIQKYQAYRRNSVTLIVKYNSSGTIQWQRALTHTGTTTEVYLYSIKANNAGSIILSGEIYTPDPGYPSSWIKGNGVIMQLPTDGSLTGTYSDTFFGDNWNYAASSYIAATAFNSGTFDDRFQTAPTSPLATGTTSPYTLTPIALSLVNNSRRTLNF